jgi:hypothetical protein
LNGKPGEKVEWDTRSFTFIQGSPDGWSQSHWQQYKQIKGDGIFIDTTRRKMNFLSEYKIIEELSTHLIYRQGLGVKITGGLQILAGVCDASKITTVEIDELSLKTVPPIDATLEGFKSCTPAGYYRIYRQWDPSVAVTDTTGYGKNPSLSYVGKADSMIKYLKSRKRGNYIAFVTRGSSPKFTQYSSAVLAAFREYGGKEIFTLNSDVKYDKNTSWILLGQRDKDGDGIGEQIVEEFKYIPNPSPNARPSVLPSDLTEILSIKNIRLATPNDSGAIVSELIGPSKSWKYAYKVFKPLENPDTDTTQLLVYGVDNSGFEKLLDSSYGGFIKLDKINADTFKYLRLVTIMQDKSNKTAPQLRLWQVIYEGLPEGTIYLDKKFSFKKPLMLEGDTMSFRAKFKNVTPYPMDSLLVNYEYFKDGNKIKKAERITRPVLGDSSVNLSYDITTLGFRDKYRFSVFANPNFAQTEKSLDNNSLRLSFEVKSDLQNPLLDVTFDGKHIMDGELVSARPNIIITDKDENKERILNDKSLIKVFLKRPESASRDSIPLNSPFLTFIPGNSKDNKAKLEYRPLDLGDGIHELSVQAYDIAGNKAGKNDYKITFEVINKSMVSNFYVYPNPFTTKAKFVFTLTGSEIPSYMKVQIMTPTGKVVKEIKREELGNMHIGNNVTDYAWDGRDEFGDPLANGLYLYRVVVKDKSGKEVDNYKTAGDKFFTKNFGKLYILR